MRPSKTVNFKFLSLTHFCIHENRNHEVLGYKSECRNTSLFLAMMLCFCLKTLSCTSKKPTLLLALRPRKCMKSEEDRSAKRAGAFAHRTLSPGFRQGSVGKRGREEGEGGEGVNGMVQKRTAHARESVRHGHQTKENVQRGEGGERMRRMASLNNRDTRKIDGPKGCVCGDQLKRIYKTRCEIKIRCNHE